MTIYIVPVEGDFDPLLAVVKRAGIQFATPDTAREYILVDNDTSHAVCAVKTKTLQAISRFADELLKDVPTVVRAVPGLVYPGSWMTTAAVLPTIDFSELEANLSKSGLISFNPGEVSKKSSQVSTIALPTDDARRVMAALPRPKSSANRAPIIPEQLADDDIVEGGDA